MNRTLVFKNRQRVRRVDTPLLRRITRWLLEESLRVRDWELCVHLVGAEEMARVNQAFLGHAGSTDVITFDHSEASQPDSYYFPMALGGIGPSASSPHPSPPSDGGEGARRTGAEALISDAAVYQGELASLQGELFVCLDDAVKQAKEFKTAWQSELTRYVIHGLLHLRGHDDLKPAARRVMKKEENRLLREISREFSLPRLARQ